MKKYKDGKYHATSGEYILSEALHEIDAAEYLTTDQKATYSFLFKKAFDLGYAAGKESTERSEDDLFSNLKDMSKEQFDQYTLLRTSLNKVLQLNEELTE